MSDEDIFNPEIIYCVTKVTIEPFISCIFDKHKYEAGDDYTLAYIESEEKNFLCIAFGEELNVSQFGSINNAVVKKGTHHSMGTVLIIGHKGGTIFLNNPLTNISTMYYSYINNISDSPQFKKIPLIEDEEKQYISSQKDKIYISNTDTLNYTMSNDGIPSIEIRHVPICSWSPSKEIYPKISIIKGWKMNESIGSTILTDYLRDKPFPSVKIDKIIQSPPHELMTDSLPYIIEDVEIVDVISYSRPPTPYPKLDIVVLPDKERSDIEDESVSCCCLKYFIPIYRSVVFKIKSIGEKKVKPNISDRQFVEMGLP